MLLRGRPLVRVALALVALSLAAMLFTWIVVPDEQDCRWGVSIWDGERAREGFVSVPCSLSEAQVRQYLDELLRVAEANGVSGRLQVGDAPVAETEPEVDPRYDEAYDAIERGDLEAAAAAYRSLLDQSPGDADAQAGLGQVELLRRTQALDERAVRRAAAENPDDVAAQAAVADLDLLGGQVEDAFNRLLDLVRRLSGAERDAARTHLVGLFELVGNQDDRVAKARTALANALF